MNNVVRSLIIICLLRFYGTAVAQEAYEKQVPTSFGLQNAYCLDISGATKDMTEEALKEYCAPAGKVTFNKKAGEYQLMQVKLPYIQNSQPWDVLVQIVEQKNNVTAHFIFDVGESFLSSKANEKESRGVQQWLREFYFAVSRKVVMAEVMGEEKKLKDLQKDLSKLESKKEQLQKEIEKAQLKIAESEKGIELNKQEQENKKAQITNQEHSVKKVTEKYNSIGKKD